MQGLAQPSALLALAATAEEPHQVDRRPQLERTGALALRQPDRLAQVGLDVRAALARQQAQRRAQAPQLAVVERALLPLGPRCRLGDPAQPLLGAVGAETCVGYQPQEVVLVHALARRPRQ